MRTTLALTLGSLVLYNANFREISAQDTLPTRLIPYELIQAQRLDLDRVFASWPAGMPLPYSVQRVGPHYVSGVGAFCYPSPRAVDWNATPVDVDRAHERLWDWRDPQLLRLWRNGPVAPRLGPDARRHAGGSDSAWEPGVRGSDGLGWARLDPWPGAGIRSGHVRVPSRALGLMG